jgi:hypothetical protein
MATNNVSTLVEQFNTNAGLNLTGDQEQNVRNFEEEK